MSWKQLTNMECTTVRWVWVGRRKYPSESLNPDWNILVEQRTWSVAVGVVELG